MRTWMTLALIATLQPAPALAAGGDTPTMPVGTSPTKGPADALVTIVEFSEFQCPFCKRVLPTLEQILETYPDDVRLVFKHNPLPFHRDAWPAATASIAAQEQGKFWEMHDKLFANQRALKPDALTRYAMEIGLNMAKFAKAMKEAPYDERIKEEQALGNRYGARGTPGFFINGLKVMGAQPFDRFKEFIDGELAEARKLAKQGLKPAEIYAKRCAANLEAAARPSADRPPPPRNHATDERYRIFVGDSHAQGPETAYVTIIESSDFQCPFCSRVTPTMKRIRDEYGDKVRIAFKHNPLSFHKRAFDAALAAEAAGKQGKFWEMHDLLFANQKKLSDEDLESYAQQLGLNMAKFKAAMADPALKRRIKDDQALVVKLGARGTPSFFINGRQMSGARPFEQFKSVIDEEIKGAEALATKGVAAKDIYGELLKDARTEAMPRAQRAAQRRPQPDPKAVYKVTLRGDEPQKGPDGALITVVEVAEFQCPFCKRAAPTMEGLMKKYGKELRVVWKHNPLPFHRNAEPAAKAAEAAKAQGKFWEMHDLLFENIRKLDDDSLRSYAEQLGLDMARFDASRNDPATGELIRADQSLARKLGARGTPAFFINGRHLRGAQPQASFEEVIEEELVRAKAAVKQGVPRAKLYAHLIKDGAESPQTIGGDDKKPAKAADAPSAPARAEAKKPYRVRPGDPTKGPKDAQVTVVEWLDFECPFCARAAGTMAQLEADYGGKIRFVAKQLPLAFHKNARPAAKAALAAHEQGKFWEMHDLLFKNQKSLGRPELVRYAMELNLDLAKFERALDGPRFDPWLAQDEAEAEEAGIKGTPNFLINGVPLTGARPIEQFKRVIDRELAASAK